MEPRLIIAYSLMALMAAFVLGITLWVRHNTDARRRRREDKRYYAQRRGREAR